MTEQSISNQVSNEYTPGSAKVLRCPVDGEPLTAHTRSGMSLATCGACHGLWLTKDVVAAGGPTPDGQVNRVLGRAADVRHDDAARMCPSCPAILIPKVVRGVEVDRCQKCGGVWLDAGEYERLRTSPEAFSKLAPAEAEESESLFRSIFRPLTPREAVAEGFLHIGAEAVFSAFGWLLDGS